jgi:hypothetical protein
MVETEFNKVKEIPFFYIIGRPRSGTTLLQLIFDAHPNVQIPSECMYIAHLLGHYRTIKTWTEPVIENFVNDLTHIWLFSPVKFNTEKIKKELLENKSFLTIDSAFKIIAKNYNSVYEKKELLLLGDKNPFYSQVFGVIFSAIPDAKYIFLIRDPRDNHVSLFNSRFTAPSITYDTLYWRKTIRAAELFKKYYPNRIYILKYEDLVTETEKHVTDLCTFLKIPFYPEMLKYRERKTEDFTKVVFTSEDFFKANHTSILEPVNTKKIGGWKTRLTKGSIRKAERIAGKYLDEYGYERLNKTPGLWSVFSTIPGKILYYFMEWLSKNAHKLPKRWQIKIVRDNHKVFALLWKIFTTKNKKI